MIDCSKCPIEEYCKANITNDMSRKEVEEYRLCPLIDLVKSRARKFRGTVVESNGHKVGIR